MDLQELVSVHYDSRRVVLMDGDEEVRELTRNDLVEALQWYPGVMTNRRRICPKLVCAHTIECEQSHYWENSLEWIDDRPLTGGRRESDSL